MKKWQIDYIMNHILCAIIATHLTKENERLISEIVFRKEFRIEGRSFE